MNKEEIIATEAGRELDALVGLKLGLVKPNIAEAFLKQAKELDEASQKYEMKSLLPKYSTDISAAWEVVEKMRERFDWVGIDTVMKNRYRCLIIDRILDGKDKIGEYVADSAPEAISKAALLAVME